MNLQSLLFLVLGVSLVACNTTPDNLVLSKDYPALKPIENIEIPVSNLTINPNKDTIIHLESKTKISIPEGTFVDKDGNVIEDEVNISVKEFRTLGEIIASGIPMEFDSAGQTYDFESAGMMDIRGSLNGEEIFFAPNKSVNIEMASHKFGNDYNTYVLDDSTGQWIYAGEHTVSVSELG